MIRNIPVAVQMYTLREQCEKDFVKTLEQVAELGYNGVELAGLWGMNSDEVRKVLNDLGLKASGSHVSFSLLETELEKVIDTQKIIGSKHVVCPSLPLERRSSEEEYLRLAKQLNQMGERCHQEGLIFSYHNHDWELVSFGNRCGLEIILEETNPDWVKAELDVYWLKRAGEDPVKWIRRYSGRTPLIHLKDMTLDEEKFFAELGTGGVDIKAIMAQGESNGVEWWVVEQDRCKRSPLESIAMSINYLKSNHLIHPVLG